MRPSTYIDIRSTAKYYPTKHWLARVCQHVACKILSILLVHCGEACPDPCTYTVRTVVQGTTIVQWVRPLILVARCPCSCGFFTSQWVNLLLILFFSYRNVYNCSERPRHMAVAIDTYNYVIIHPVSNIIKEYNINNYSSFNSRLIVYYYSLHSFTLAE